MTDATQFLGVVPKLGTDSVATPSEVSLAQRLVNIEEPGLAFQGAVPLTVGTSYVPQRGIGVACTVAGSMTITLADGSIIAVPLAVGWQEFPFGVSKVNSATATATYFNLI